MIQYIPKAAIKAEIERRIKDLIDCHANKYDGYAGEIFGLRRLSKFLDTLEVKEVDLEDDVDKILKENDWNFDKIDFYQFAKYFFELGLKIQKGE